MPRRKTDPTIPVHDSLTPAESKARALTQRLQVAVDAAHLKSDDDSWIPNWYDMMHLYRQIAIPEPDGDPRERERLEQRAAQGDVEALAELIRRDPDYLRTPQVVAAIRTLRSHAVFARTPERQREATAGLRTLTKALLPDLRGNKCSPAPYDVARVYGDLLKAYQTAKRGEQPPPVSLPRGYWPNTGPCPTHVTPAGRYIKPTRGTGLLPAPTFTIPLEDIDLLRAGRPPSELALWRTAELFGLSEDRAGKLKTLGRKEITGSQ